MSRQKIVLFVQYISAITSVTYPYFQARVVSAHCVIEGGAASVGIARWSSTGGLGGPTTPTPYATAQRRASIILCLCGIDSCRVYANRNSPQAPVNELSAVYTYNNTFGATLSKRTDFFIRGQTFITTYIYIYINIHKNYYRPSVVVFP